MSENFNHPFGVNPPIIPEINNTINPLNDVNKEAQLRDDHREEGIGDNNNSWTVD